MNDVYLAQASAVSSIGGSLDEMWPRLRAGESAIGPVKRFQTGRLGFHKAACVNDLDGEPGNLTWELTERCLSQLGPIPRETFVIWAGIKGVAEYVEARQAGLPFHGPRFPAQYREQVCQRLGLSGAGMEVNAACASSTAALALGSAMIAQGQCPSVLVAAADAVTYFTFSGFSALKALSPGVCRPFDANRDGLALGDGAVALLLLGAGAAGTQKNGPLARVTGWGVANDANHITGPARDGCGLVAAIEAALRRARRSPEEIEAICGHGTGTVYNDAMELTSFERVFGPQWRAPLFSIKGAIGHTLGAAGGLEVAVCARALAEKTVPATSGLQTPDPRAAGRASSTPQILAGGNVLTVNSGFGGVNAALILEAV